MDENTSINKDENTESMTDNNQKSSEIYDILKEKDTQPEEKVSLDPKEAKKAEKEQKKLLKKERKAEKRNRTEKKISRVVTLVANLVIISVFVIVLSDFFGIAGSKTEKTITIKEGDGISSISKKLKDEGIVVNDFLFKSFFLLSEPDYVLMPGTFRVNAKMSYSKLVEEIVISTALNDRSENITIPEGFTNNEIADILKANEVISDTDAFKKELENFSFTVGEKTIDGSKNSLNGFLFPDTYNFHKKSDANDIISTMTDNFNKHWKIEYTQRAKELNMSVEEVVILASIIQREAKYTEDFYNVASVFHNRLKIGMRLQSCATVQFILNERRAVLTEEDTKIDSPYNTYLHTGLPPTAICSPGDLAIDAALFPYQTDYLYFFCDKEGETHFAKDYKEHLRLQQKFPVE